jgi:hypothetical protein
MPDELLKTADRDTDQYGDGSDAFGKATSHQVGNYAARALRGKVGRCGAKGSINRFAEKSGFVTLPGRILTQDEGVLS